MFEKTMAPVQGAAAEAVPEDIARQEDALQQRFQMVENMFEPMCLQQFTSLARNLHISRKSIQAQQAMKDLQAKPAK